jgi:hypothetical protein
MTQASLFAAPTKKAKPRRCTLPAPWRRIDKAPGKLWACYAGPSGYRIEHCGHPTANWPWALYSPKGELLVGRNGMAFRLLADAAAEVDRILAGGTPRRIGEPAPTTNS